jgi:hypothetical protein
MRYKPNIIKLLIFCHHGGYNKIELNNGGGAPPKKFTPHL